MERDRERELAHRLIREVNAQRKIRKEKTSLSALLWNAARNQLPPCCDAVMTDVEEAYPAKKRAPYHLAELFRRIDIETDRYADKAFLGGTINFPKAKRFIEDFAARNLLGNDDGTQPASPEACEQQSDKEKGSKENQLYLEFRDASNALQKVARRLRLDLRAPKRKVLPPMDRCDLCWRTGFRNGRAAYLCSTHRSGSSAYQKAIRLRCWRAPDQPPGNYSSLQLMVFKEIDPYFFMGNSHRYELPKGLLSGDEADIERIPNVVIAFDLELQLLPFVTKYVEHRARKRIQQIRDLASALLRILDPIHPTQNDLHRKMYRAALRDQRILLRMLWIAESWLTVEARMKRRARGGQGREEKENSYDRRIVVPLRFR